MDDRDPRGPRPGAEPAGLSPVRAFFLLGTLLTAIAAGFFATRDPAPSAPSASPPRSPDYALTDAEAIAEFERLRLNAIAAVRGRDLSLVDEVFTPGGPLHRRATREINALLEKSVVDHTKFISLDVRIVRNASTEIRILERSRLEPCFRTVEGADVSTGPAAVRQVAEWTMHLHGTRWLLHDAVISDDEAVRPAEAECE